MGLFKFKFGPKPSPRKEKAATARASLDDLAQIAAAQTKEKGRAGLTREAACKVLQVPVAGRDVISGLVDRSVYAGSLIKLDDDTEPLGRGQSSVVHPGTMLPGTVDPGRRGAVKVLDAASVSQSTALLGMLRSEWAALRALPPHEHIIALHGPAIVTRCEVALVLTLMEADLLSLIEDEGPLPEDECRQLFCQMASALGHMHAHGWAHRDVKPENVCLISRRAPPPGRLLHRARLIDFGAAAQCAPSANTLGSFCGTPVYMAPEVTCWVRRRALFNDGGGHF